MTIYQAIILGVIQGLTEFLPISSSGHLVLGQKLLGLEALPLFYDVLMHLGTLVAIIIYFIPALKKLSANMVSKIIIGTIPAVVAGLIIEPLFERHLKSLFVVVIGLFISGIYLLSTRKTSIKEAHHHISTSKAIVVGIIQAIAIIPGISRSGSTVSTLLHLNVDPSSAFTFSFLLSIPAVIGALVLQLIKIESLTPLISLPAIAALISSAIVGLLSLRMLDTIIKKSQLYYFGFYNLTLSLLVFLTLIG